MAGKAARPVMGETSDIEARRHLVEQVAAISAFEGLTPSPAYKLLRDRYVSGEISAREFKRLVAQRWKRVS